MKVQEKNESHAVLLLTYRSSQEAEEVLALLKENGIPAFVESYYSNLILGSVIDVGGARLMVDSRWAKEAVDLLNQNGLEVPHPEKSTAGKISSFADKSALLKKVKKKYRLPLLLVCGIILILLLVVFSYLFFFS
ncbi:hypothetical protein HMPREF1869_01492 [Bacteroidales bacterium KA00251]|nr:hypothetical protein HMPREF1869_01492 [Bacteroidales bacterium KA00251]